MLAIIVAVVIGAAVGAFTTASLKWGKSALSAVMVRIRQDHSTLHGGRAWGIPQSVSAGKQCSVQVLVACAPSRALRTSEIDPDRAIPFLRERRVSPAYSPMSQFSRCRRASGSLSLTR